MRGCIVSLYYTPLYVHLAEAMNNDPIIKELTSFYKFPSWRDSTMHATCETFFEMCVSTMIITAYEVVLHIHTLYMYNLRTILKARHGVPVCSFGWGQVILMSH